MKLDVKVYRIIENRDLAGKAFEIGQFVVEKMFFEKKIAIIRIF